MSSATTRRAPLPGTGRVGRAEGLLDDVRDALDGRRLVWFGTRGEDGESLLSLPELAASFAVTAPLRSARIPEAANVTLESLSGVRPDLDCHDIDLDTGGPAQEFRRLLLREVSSRCAVVTYRPARLVSTMAFSMTTTMLLAGLFKDRQMAFEHKPWVETSLAQRGVRTLGWQYVADEHRLRVKRMASTGPVVLRASRASGGVGVVRLDDASSVDERWPSDADGFVGAASFLDGATPLNLSGCIYSNGIVHLHPPSVQLIGVPSCTNRPFGYCGNDFGAVAALDSAALSQLDELGRTVGAWLHSERYLGAFGVDALWKDGRIYFTEVNPRFQGSSALSADVAEDLGLPSLFMEHLAASLGITPEDHGLTVGEWVENQASVSHVVVHNTGSTPLERDPSTGLPSYGNTVRITQVLPAGVRALPGATVCRLVVKRAVTEAGFDLDAETERRIEAVATGFRTVAEEQGGT